MVPRAGTSIAARIVLILAVLTGCATGLQPPATNRPPWDVATQDILTTAVARADPFPDIWLPQGRRSLPDETLAMYSLFASGGATARQTEQWLAGIDSAWRRDRSTTRTPRISTWT